MGDKIIQFPGRSQTAPHDESKLEKPSQTEQQKAIDCILSGMAFVFVGIKPKDTGADFFTALHGDGTDLRNAEDHLPAVIHRLFVRKGIL